MNLADLQVTPASTVVRILLDGDLAGRIAQARVDLKAAKRQDAASGGGLSDRAPAIEARLAELEAEAESKATTFKFQAIGQGRFSQIVAKHPPTKAQWERFREQQKGTPFLTAPEFDPDGLSVDLIAACCVEPSGDTKEWKRLRDDQLSDGQWAELFKAALQVNTEPSIRPTYGTGTDATPNTGPDSTTQPNGGFPSQSSTDEQ